MGISITITPPAAAAAAVAQVAGALSEVQNVYDQVNAYANVVGAFKPQELRDALENVVKDTVMGSFGPLVSDLAGIATEVNGLIGRIEALEDALGI